MFCPYCGNKLNNDFLFCPSCGKNVDQTWRQPHEREAYGAPIARSQILTSEASRVQPRSIATSNRTKAIYSDNNIHRDAIAAQIGLGKYIELFKCAPTSVKFSIVVWLFWSCINLCLFIFSPVSCGTYLALNLPAMAGVLRGSRRWRNGMMALSIIAILFCICVVVYATTNEVPDALIIRVIGGLVISPIALLYLVPLYCGRARYWFSEGGEVMHESKVKIQKCRSWLDCSDAKDLSSSNYLREIKGISFESMADKNSTQAAPSKTEEGSDVSVLIGIVMGLLIIVVWFVMIAIVSS